MVRRACASFIDQMAKLIPKETVKENIYPLYEILMKDKRDSVKIKAIESSLGIIEIFKDQGLVQDFMELVKKADERKIKWRVRYAIGETLADFSKYLHQD